MKLAVVVAAVAVLAARADTPKDEPPGISIFASDHQEVPNVDRTRLALDLAESALGRRPLPHLHLVLIYVDRRTADIQGVPERADVFMVHVVDGQPPTYYEWIVGEANDHRLAMACVMLLDRQWNLKLEKRKINELANRVRLEMAGVVTARDLARESEPKTGR